MGDKMSNKMSNKMEQQQSDNSIHSLRWFMIKRFLLVMLFVFISEEIIGLFYRAWMVDLLQNVLHVNDFYVSTNEGSILLIVLQMLLLSLAGFLPNDMAFYIQQVLGNDIGKKLENSVSVSISSPVLDTLNIYGLNEVYQFAVVIIYFGLLVITLLPYALGAYWYCKIISRKVQELLEREKKQKEEYDKQRNLLLSDIAHDIKTPITTVCGYAKALSDHVVCEEEKQEEYLQAIYAKSMRMSELITLLFEYVKLDSEGFVLHKQPGDVAELLRENAALLYADFEAKGIELLVDISEEKFPYEMDKIQMSRAVGNILTNMIRYNEKGNTVSVQLKNPCQIRIADNGMPISDELAEHIFEPFSRGDEARSTKGGSGLGLSIAAKIVQMHGGRLTLERNGKDGYVKTFVITLPGN